MFSKACEYALRAMIYISGQSLKGYKSGVREIADQIDSPEYFTAKILQDLSRKKLVDSVKGPNGGFYIRPGRKSVTLAQIISAVDGNGVYTGCLLGVSKCTDKHPCPIHYSSKLVREKLRNLLEKTTIEELGRDLDKKKVFLS